MGTGFFFIVLFMLFTGRILLGDSCCSKSLALSAVTITFLTLIIQLILQTIQYLSDIITCHLQRCKINCMFSNPMPGKRFAVDDKKLDWLSIGSTVNQ